MQSRAFVLTASACWFVALPSHAAAQAAPSRRVVVAAQPLGSALQDLARQFSIELLFTRDVVGQRQAPAVTGRMTADAALKALLAGSGLVVKRIGDGALVVTMARESSAGEEGAVPEILVEGHRTQNVDIRRLTDGVQPYQVLTRDDIRATPANSVEDLIAKRLSQDVLGLTTSQVPLSGGGAVRSTVDLRGLGTDETLVLVDGRRMPRLPAPAFVFNQPDINGLSPSAIERVEAITSTAGGIYGPGAVAGVVNLVLRRDYRGVDLSMTRGISQKGDAATSRVDARVGFTPDGGATDVMVSYSRSMNAGLRASDRDYALRARALRFASGYSYLYDLPMSNSINVVSSDGRSLTLKPAYGGLTLSSSLTSLPLASGRTSTQIGAALLANAGMIDLSLTGGAGGLDRSLVAARRSTSLLANVRHRFGSGLETYVDYLRLSNRGRVRYSLNSSYFELPASDPRNPFTQAIGISMPMPDFGETGGTKTLTTRLSVGGLISLPGLWKANLDYSRGSARQTMITSGNTYSLAGYYALFGLSLAGGPVLNPFGDGQTFLTGLRSYSVPTMQSRDQTNRLRDMSLRFAGPMMRLGGGDLSATLLLEQRKETVDPSKYTSLLSVFGLPYQEDVPGYGERIRSIYAEARAPLISTDAAFRPLRGLELQLALRHDATRVTLQRGYLAQLTAASDAFDTAGHAATLYTAGAKVTPVRGLLVRGSVATGERTPPISDIANARLIGKDGPDPQRGNGPITMPYDLVVFDHGKITPEVSRSLSAGVVLTPFRSDGPVLSFDYTHIRKSGQIDATTVGNVFYFLQYESLFPDRVTRAPLTTADAARGYTGGVITRIDASYLNVGWTVIDAIDGRLQVPIRTTARGNFLFHGAVTWQPHYRRSVTPSQADEDFVNTADGALAWRGNAGIDWTHGPLQMSISGRYFGSYKVTYGAEPQVANPTVLAEQGAERVGAQALLDLVAGYSFKIRTNGSPPQKLSLRLSVQNLLDRRPATVVAAEGAYSYYGDPYRRRFEITGELSF